ncbi:deoxyribodipyrimidine photo-lyase [Parasphingorhabdus sp. JC815]|uniref:cryptochrome/photolyase family protein n=1 Tax=Parasphingorhabdus sp. JC815 TaxID=3232140 RepID=UPI0034588CF3
MNSPVIIWFRRDLRLSDQAAVTAAAARGPVIPVFVLDDETPGDRKMGAASRWWLHHSLKSLDQRLREKDSRLILKCGNAGKVLADIAREAGAKEIHALHHYEPWWLNAEKKVRDALDNKAELVLHDGNYLLPPGVVTTGNGDPYKIFTPFWKSLRAIMPPSDTVPVPQKLESPQQWPLGDNLEDWKLLPSPNWAAGFEDVWKPGENGARANVDKFIEKAPHYDAGRNLPSKQLVSRLSPHLHFGEISPSHVWHRITAHHSNVETYLKELGWRDYAQTVIYQFPQYGSESYREQFCIFPWRDMGDAQVRKEFKAWCDGETGYPIVDAGMRELWSTGWMHNRVRMIAASFLIKHLLIDWREGEQWFWDTLVDADFASNSVNWQWVAGTGVDSNMFVRIMAPLTQSEKFNAGDYIRKWVPELADISDPYIHDPEEDGVKPANYPTKIISHKNARERALTAYREIK